MRPSESFIGFRSRTVAAGLPRVVRTVDAEHYVSSLGQASSLDLDWSAIHRIDRLAGCILVSALIGSLDEIPVRVRLPQSSFARTEVLNRAGLLFALAHREGSVEHDGGGEFQAVLNRFHSAVGHIQLSWDSSKAVGGRETGHRSHAWTNLHQGLLNYAGDNFGDAMKKWVELDVLQSRASRLPEGLLDDVALVSSELLENVIEHATTEVVGSGGPRSLAHAMITEGGTRSHDRLYLTMQDNGYGIARTARPKLGSAEMELSDDQLMVGLVDGTLLTFPSQRGRGLPKIWEAARRQGGTLQIACGDIRLTGKEGKLAPTAPKTFIDGSAIILMFPLKG